MKRKLTIALAGNANVGKSVVFNKLTGLHQHVGNWPGKTVERAEGTLHFKGYTIEIIDLPGIYSLSTFSLEELISREYIAFERPDLVINIVDASVLERNLFFTLQLIELETPMVIALNQMDMATKKGIKIDHQKLERLLGVPVIPTVAITGTGIYELVEKSVEIVEKGGTKPAKMRYGQEVEERIEELAETVGKVQFAYPPRWTAIKLLEGDEQVEKEIRETNSEILPNAEKLAKEIERIHGHPCSTVITSERYEIAGKVAREVQQVVQIKVPMSEKLHTLTTHRIFGYPTMMVALVAIFYSIFTFGDYASGLLSELLYGLDPVFQKIFGASVWAELIWGGVFEGLIAGITIALPYIIPFYLILYILEDSGYLSRIAFLMDTFMHRIGLHGKAFIPAMLGFGCNVPACLGCRIMETERERVLAGFVTTLVPCAATTSIILGLVGAFVSPQWALTLYIIDLLIILFLGRLAFKVLPGEPTALIMEMHDYRFPHVKTVITQTWFRLREFIKVALPLIIVGSVVMKIMGILNLLEPVSSILSPVTVNWLGLPAITGITLIFGVLRKELTLIMLATLLETTDFAQVLTPVQMIVYALVTMLYIPCIATIAACIKEFGWKKASFITISEIMVAIFVGGIAYRTLLFLRMP